jgi:hypothetical protein
VNAIVAEGEGGSIATGDAATIEYRF